ncbi:hypothetical protein, partial [Acetobacter estunensis]|uniref:hypothetical protein n=1 Tax=Acetobacter estunensis TaxID=104097 RepID=UPI001C2D3D2E
MCNTVTDTAGGNSFTLEQGSSLTLSGSNETITAKANSAALTLAGTGSSVSLAWGSNYDNVTLTGSGN